MMLQHVCLPCLETTWEHANAATRATFACSTTLPTKTRLGRARTLNPSRNSSEDSMKVAIAYYKKWSNLLEMEESDISIM